MIYYSSSLLGNPSDQLSLFLLKVRPCIDGQPYFYKEMVEYIICLFQSSHPALKRNLVLPNGLDIVIDTVTKLREITEHAKMLKYYWYRNNNTKSLG